MNKLCNFLARIFSKEITIVCTGEFSDDFTFRVPFQNLKKFHCAATQCGVMPVPEGKYSTYLCSGLSRKQALTEKVADLIAL